MKTILLFVAIIFALNSIIYTQSIVDMKAEGIVFPKLTNTQRNALSADEGQVIYNTTSKKLNIYDIGTSTYRWDDVYATNGTKNTSDRRFKENIEPIPYGLSEILKLNLIKFQWIDNKDEAFKLGLIAQELQPLISKVVKTYDFEVSEKDGSFKRVELDKLGVYYSDLIPVLIKGMQEQHELIIDLEQNVKAFSAQIKILKKG